MKKKINILIVLLSLFINLFPTYSKIGTVSANSVDRQDQSNVKPINQSKNAKSVITSDLGSREYQTIQAMDNSDPGSTFNYVKTEPETAPFSIQLDNETLSTLNGSLSLKSDDLSVLGPNGLSFALTRTYNSSSSQFYQLNNEGINSDPSQEEKISPIGKGWSWEIPYVLGQYGSTDLYVHPAGSGTYKIVGNTLEGYPWKDLSFELDSHVFVNGLRSMSVLRSIKGINQFFDEKGRIIQISDNYENKIQFYYSVLNDKLIAIVDGVGNTINISYMANYVTVTKGSYSITYYKTNQNGIDLLTKVEDSAGRITTYDYSIKDAKYNMHGSTPLNSNPYALLTGITYPTGAKSVYYYENTPYTRFLNNDISKQYRKYHDEDIDNVNQVYRVVAREDHLTLSNGSFEVKNRKDITYNGDIGSLANSDLTYSVTVNDGLTSTEFFNKKDFIDTETPPAIYNIKITASSGNYRKITDMTYNEEKRYTNPTITTVTNKNAVTNENSQPITSIINYDDYRNVMSSTNPLTIQTTYGYDPNSHLLLNVSQPVSATQVQYTEYTRNDKGSVTSEKIREGSNSGKILKQIGYENFDVYGNSLQTRVTTNQGQETLYQTEYSALYNGAFPTKLIVNVKDIDGATSTITKQLDYDPKIGKPIQFVDGNQNITKYQYDILGRLIKVIQPDLSNKEISYLDDTNQIRVINEMGQASLTTWNPIGWKTETGLIENGVYRTKQKYNYDQHGRQNYVEDALGNRTYNEYDQWSRPNKAIYPDNSFESVLYDDIYFYKIQTDPEGNVKKEHYDKLGRLDTRTESTKTKTNVTGVFDYDYAGNLTVFKDHDVPPQNITRMEYDVLGHLTAVTNAKNEKTTYQYDYLGKILKTTFPDYNTKQNKYDELGRLIQTTDANNKIQKFYHDANGNQIGSKDRKGETFKNTYDYRNFLLQSDVLDSQGQVIANESVSYQYDLVGRRIHMSDSTGTTLYSYTPSNGFLSKVTYPDGRILSYSYDSQGNITSLTDPFGSNSYYGYDSRNRLISVGSSLEDIEAQYSYYKNNLLNSTRQKNGVTSYFTYDGLQLSTLTQKKSDGSPLNTFSYSSYDNNGNQLTKMENGVSYSFTYDPLNRIQTSSQFDETFDYDNRGNRTSMTTNHPFDSPDSTYTYDKRNRLTNVTTKNGRNVVYKYNGDGVLWERTENGQSTRYYNRGSNVIAEGNVINGVATLKARYIRGNGLVAREDSAGKAYYVQNGHGDVVNLMDSTGLTKINSYQYDIWGNIVSQQENVPQLFKYSGEMFDDATSLQYLRARWYDPSMGRFVNEDSYEGQIDNPLSLNLYTYVENNPLTQTDPTGHCIEDACIGEVGALIWLYRTFVVGAAIATAPTPIAQDPPPAADSPNNGLTVYITPIEQQSTSVTQTTFGEQRPTIITTPFQDQSPTVITTPVSQDGVTVQKSSVDLTGFRKDHILNRHRAGQGIPGKTEFPATWSDEKILAEISDVATDPKSTWSMGKWDSPYATGTRDGIDIRVDFYPLNHPNYAGKISTGYPTNVPANP
ncbi:EndoU domain-containing protein [Paenibacillus alba]|uniref:RHS repeat-associated core domain-containing protein n=1 Tax=Paenibacillus alba TaxID=1197127 RepID=UPI0015665D25|nr:RHS repeat-associated core domain-containing protein [Paenibacillus alba]NQX64626.1 EndoU domain-containing protein [Paenibacillus alba]